LETVGTLKFLANLVVALFLKLPSFSCFLSPFQESKGKAWWFIARRFKQDTLQLYSTAFMLKEMS